MQNSRNKSKIAIRLSFCQQGTKPFKKQIHFSPRSEILLESVVSQAYRSSPGGGGGVRWYSTNRYTLQIYIGLYKTTNKTLSCLVLSLVVRYAGRLRPGVQPLTFYIPVLTEKVSLFVYYLLTNSTPFPIILLKMHCLLLRKTVLRDQSRVTFQKRRESSQFVYFRNLCERF